MFHFFKTTRQQDYKFFGGNVEGRFLLFLNIRNSKPQNHRRKIRADTCDTWRFIKIRGNKKGA
jgi:hypothetical protein